MSGCHGNHACWEKIRLNILIIRTTLTYSEKFMKSETMSAEPHLRFSGFYLELLLTFEWLTTHAKVYAKYKEKNYAGDFTASSDYKRFR